MKRKNAHFTEMSLQVRCTDRNAKDWSESAATIMQKLMDRLALS